MPPLIGAFFEQQLDDAAQRVARRADRLSLWVGAPLVLGAIALGAWGFAAWAAPELVRLGLDHMKLLALAGCVAPLMAVAIAVGKRLSRHLARGLRASWVTEVAREEGLPRDALDARTRDWF